MYGNDKSIKYNEKLYLEIESQINNSPNTSIITYTKPFFKEQRLYTYLLVKRFNFRSFVYNIALSADYYKLKLKSFCSNQTISLFLFLILKSICNSKRFLWSPILLYIHQCLSECQTISYHYSNKVYSLINIVEEFKSKYEIIGNDSLRINNIFNQISVEIQDHIVKKNINKKLTRTILNFNIIQICQTADILTHEILQSKSTLKKSSNYINCFEFENDLRNISKDNELLDSNELLNHLEYIYSTSRFVKKELFGSFIRKAFIKENIEIRFKAINKNNVK